MVDAYVLRCMQRRCNYDEDMVLNAQLILLTEQFDRAGGTKQQALEQGTAFAYYMAQYQRSNLADIVILPYLTYENVKQMSLAHINKLLSIIEDMLKHKPFEVLTVHDAFHSLPSNCNWVRWHYKEILADLADSELLTDLLNQLYKSNGKFEKLSDNLGDTIRKSNYGLG